MDYLIHHMLRTSARRFPDKEALVHGTERLSYQQLNDRAASLAATLQRIGVRRGDRVGIFLKPSVPLVESIFGIAKAGAVFVPIYQGLLRDQVAHIVRDCGMRVVITSTGMLDAIRGISDDTNLESVVLVDEKLDIEWDPTVAIHSHLESNETAAFEEMSTVDRDLAAILYTSGSTGKPKGVMLSHRNLLAGASIVSEYLQISETDRILAALPLSFDAGLNQLTTSVQQGACLVLLNFVFAKQIVDTVIKERITGLAGVPPMWCLLAHSGFSEKKRPETLRYITNTGGVLPEHVLSKLRAALPDTDVYLMYGLTEAFRSTYLPPQEIDRRVGSMGKAIPNTEILVVNEDGRRCEPNEVGELVHHGPTVSLGYWGQPELTKQVIRDHPFPLPGAGCVDKVVYSGDLVRMDEDGYLYFVSRRDNMIKTSGFRVSPTEVEEALCRTGRVQQAAVIGLPDEMLGQRIHAYVVPLSPEAFDVREILAAAADRLPAYMIPKSLEALDELPKTSSGKVNYPVLRARAEAPGATSDSNATSEANADCG